MSLSNSAVNTVTKRSLRNVPETGAREKNAPKLQNRTCTRKYNRYPYEKILDHDITSLNASRPQLGQRLRSTSSTDFSLPQLCTKFRERAYSHAGPAAWNSMPKHIRAEPDIRVFRKLLKTHSRRNCRQYAQQMHIYKSKFCANITYEKRITVQIKYR